jgi:NADPH:quinone reductase-like Zn-dependent oxidoreductase
MKAARIRQFGPPSVIEIEDIPRPQPEAGQVLVRVMAARVGPWDALIREGKSALNQKLPLIPGSDVAGVVEAVGDGVSGFNRGDEVYGSTNEQFIGGYGEYALASAKMLAAKPETLSYVGAASAPVIAVTAWQMLHDYANGKAGQTVLIHGAAGNVGGYAVQLAHMAGLHVVATAATRDAKFVRGLGAERVVDYQDERFEDALAPVDIVLDLVGGETQERSLQVLKPGGILVSAVSPIPEAAQTRHGVRAIFFYVEVTTERLRQIAQLFDQGTLRTRLGTILPLDEARTAHEMLAGAPHLPGKIVLKVAE